MSTPEQPELESATFQAQSLTVARLPDENLAMLSRFQFQVLCDGEVNEARAGRDLCIGFFVSAVIGFIGLIATIDWDTAFKVAHKGPFVWTALLFAIALSSACGALIYHRRCKRTLKNSAYSALMKGLSDHFAK
jgi:hypothetical protein